MGEVDPWRERGLMAEARGARSGRAGGARGAGDRWPHGSALAELHVAAALCGCVMVLII